MVVPATIITPSHRRAGGTALKYHRCRRHRSPGQTHPRWPPVGRPAGHHTHSLARERKKCTRRSGGGDNCCCRCVWKRDTVHAERKQQRLRRVATACGPHPHPAPTPLQRHATRQEADDMARSQAASSAAAAAVDRLARGPGLGPQPSSRRCCSPASRERLPIGSRGYFRRHEHCHRYAQTPPMLLLEHVDGILYSGSGTLHQLPTPVHHHPNT